MGNTVLRYCTDAPDHDQQKRSNKFSRKSLFDATVEGYCLVFKRKTDFCELQVIRNKNTKADILRVNKQKFNEKHKNKDDWNNENKYFGNMEDLLKSLRENKDGTRKKYYVQYRIIESEYDEEHIYVVISTQESLIENWAEERDVDVPINAEKAIKSAKKYLPKFLLAKRTKVPQQKQDDDDDEDDDDFKYTFDESVLEPLVDCEKWENIHIGYESKLHCAQINIFCKPFNIRKKHPVPSAISHVLYLRILYEILTDDEALNGSDFVIEKMFANKYHPLCQFFAMHQQDAQKRMLASFDAFKCVACRWQSKGRNTNFLDGIRRYYGEQIAFYFAFLVHYTVWLYPIALFGLIWWIIEMSIVEITSSGSVFLVLFTILWSTLMIENWFRRQWKLRFRWGMMRHKQTEIPRPTFRGRYIISTINGLRIETHTNKCLYWFKRIVSICISFICVLLVAAVTVIIWSLQNESRKQSQYLSLVIGVINSVQILLFNTLYTRLALFLNDWEGHRLQEEYYDQLVIKRISFIVINSFYSLFYIAFFDSREDYDDNRVRLEALRMQLVVLFLMAIIYQNSMEIFFPVFCPRIMRYCRNCCSSKKNRRKKNKKRKQDDEYAELELIINDKSKNINDLTEWHVDDILHQSELSVSPDVLDNTAEIIVLHGYVTLFIVVFPLMPLLAVINNYAELKVDKYNLIHTQRPVPASSGGLGVWTSVLSVFAIVSIYSNLALLTFKTDIVINFLVRMEDFFADIEQVYWTNKDMFENQVTFFFISTTFLVFVVVGVRMCIPPISNETVEDIARQETCQRELSQINP